MEREIKFRAWVKQYYYSSDTEFKMMYYGEDYYSEGDFFCDGKNVFEISGDYYGGVSILKVDKAFIMQYTGLKDKNGKEIYEGDIIKIAGYSFKIVWVLEDACFALQESRGRITSICIDNLNGEVVGNIHETPELLTP